MKNPKKRNENLKNANKTLEKLIEKTKYDSLIDKIIKVNTFVYSKIWHASWLIDTGNTDFGLFERKVASYLQRIKSTDLYDQVSKQRPEGGLNLINIKERIIAIKTKLILEAIDQKPETDNVIYQLGTCKKKIPEKKIPGQKKEISTKTPKTSLIK